MSEQEPGSNDFFETAKRMPCGFGVTTLGASGLFSIRYRTTGMGCAGCFFFCFIVMWTTACIQLAPAIYGAAEVPTETRLAAVAFWIIEIVVICFVCWYFFGVSVFTFESDVLIVERRFVFRLRHWRIRKADIVTVIQEKDGGEDGDSFPSWGLVVMSPARRKVLYRQPFDKSNWLGGVIAFWAGVNFVQATPEE